MRYDTATGLPAGTPVYAVKGFSPRCRLAAYVAGKPRAYVAMQDTAGRRGPPAVRHEGIGNRPLTRT